MANYMQPGTYKITNVKAGVAMDLSGGDHRTIMGFDYHGGSNQQWTVSEPDGDQNQTLYCQAENLYLSIEGPAADGERIVATSSPNKWAIRRDGEDGSVWRVFVPGTGFNFDLADHGNVQAGTIVQLWDCTAGKNQLWRFESL